MSVVRQCLEFASLYEAELLTELMLRHWRHPLANHEDFRNELLEAATEALRSAAAGDRLLESVSPESTSFVAAIWYAEWVAMPSSEAEDSRELHQRREKWLEDVKRAKVQD